MAEETANTPKDAIKTAIAERLSHPVLGTFLLLFVICNWRVLFFLFVDQNAAAERMRLCANYTGWVYGVLLPLGLTIMYVMASPLLRFFAGQYERYWTTKDAAGRYKLDMEILQQQAEIVERQSVIYRANINELQSTIASLNNVISTLRSQHESLLRSIQNLGNLNNPVWQQTFRNMTPAQRQGNLTEIKRLMDDLYEKIDAMNKQQLSVDSRSTIKTQANP